MGICDLKNSMECLKKVKSAGEYILLGTIIFTSHRTLGFERLPNVKNWIQWESPASSEMTVLERGSR